MKKTFHILITLLICMLLSAPLSMAQGRGGQRGNSPGRSAPSRTAPARPGNSGSQGGGLRGNPGVRPGRPGATPSRPNNQGTQARPQQPQQQGRPSSPGLRPGANTGSGQGLGRPQNNLNRPGNQGNQGHNGPRPGYNQPNNKPENRPGYRPGDNHGDYRPNYHRPPGGGGGPHYGYHRPERPYLPPRPHMMPVRPWAPPRPPMAWRPVGRYPVFNTILGVTFGTGINVSVNFLANAGYNVLGYGDGLVYLSNVNMLNMLWPNVTLFYPDGGGLYGSQFVYSTPYADMNRYYSAYNNLCAQYGNPYSSQQLSGGGVEVNWFGNNGNFVSLRYAPGYANNGALGFFTTLSFGR